MHKLFNILLLIFFLVDLSAQDKSQIELDNKRASEYFRKLMQTAHPVPRIHKEIDIAVPLAAPPKYSLFLNVNTIEEENETYKMQNESSITVNPKNPKNLIASAVDYRDTSSTHVYVTYDGARTWKNINLKKPYPGWRASNDPSVAFGSDGTGYLVYGGFGDLADSTNMVWGENGVFIARSTNDGKTWEAHIPVIVHKGKQTLDSVFEDKYYISVDNSSSSPYSGHLYIPWKRVTPLDSATQIVLSKSTDKGSTWSLPVAVSNRKPGTSEDTTYGQSFPLAVTGPNGELYVAWNDGIVHGVGFSKSTDGGLTFSEPRIVHYYNIFGETKNLPQNGWRHSLKGRVRAEAYPSIVCDITGGSRNGYLYLTWAAEKVPNIYYSYSSDGGNSWSQPVIVHSDTTNDQFWQWLSQDPMTGDLAVMYLDSRNDPANILCESFVSYSSDGGKTWIDRQSADVGSDLRRNPFYGEFAGDYSGNAFYNGIIYPSWVDMRNAISDIYDSDVFTAIVNTRLPNPPENFISATIPVQPQKIKLTWDTPKERAFGQPLNKDDFHYVLFRNDTLLTTVPSSGNEYIDDNLIPFEKYRYSIRAVSGADTSIKKDSSAYPGGAKQPAPPQILSANGSDEFITSLAIKIPSLRADNFTPLVNLDTIEIFRNGVLSVSYNLQKSDTGKTLMLTDTTNERGYYNYQAKISASYGESEIEPQSSDLSNMFNAYTGPVESIFSESFDSQILKRYNISGTWGLTDKFYYSPSYSFTDSPDSNYKPLVKDTLIIFPVKYPADGKLGLNFWHAAINHKSDSALVEYSNNNRQSWQRLGYYSMDQYPAWSDSVLNKDDWKHELLIPDTQPGDTVYFRFRFLTNALINKDGWYIDDITVDVISSVGQTPPSVPALQSKFDFLIYPNPASGIINIESESVLKEGITELTLMSSIGRYYSVEDLFYSSDERTITLNISTIPQGVYLLYIRMEDGSYYAEKISVIR